MGEGVQPSTQDDYLDNAGMGEAALSEAAPDATGEAGCGEHGNLWLGKLIIQRRGRKRTAKLSSELVVHHVRRIIDYWMSSPGGSR